MIKNKQDLKDYLEADRIANKKSTRVPKFGGDITWRFLIALRKLEYHINCDNSIFRKPLILIYKAIWYHYSVKTSISIHPNCFDKGLVIYHYGTIIVN